MKMNNLSREKLLREKERIETSLKELDTKEKQERAQKENAEKMWDRKTVWIVVSGHNEGNCNSNASAKVNVYLTKEHAIAHYEKNNEEQTLSVVPIGCEISTWIDLENQPEREGMH